MNVSFVIEELFEAEATVGEGAAVTSVTTCCRAESFVIEELLEAEATAGEGAAVTSVTTCCRAESYQELEDEG